MRLYGIGLGFDAYSAWFGPLTMTRTPKNMPKTPKFFFEAIAWRGGLVSKYLILCGTSRNGKYSSVNTLHFELVQGSVSFLNKLHRNCIEIKRYLPYYYNMIYVVYRCYPLQEGPIQGTWSWE